MRLSPSPAEEDWARARGSRMWEAVERPFRLVRNCSQDGYGESSDRRGEKLIPQKGRPGCKTRQPGRRVCKGN